MNRWIGIVLLLIVPLVGCLGGTGKAPLIRQYALEYPPPQGGGRPGIEATLRVEGFFADRMFVGHEMLYRQGPFRRDAYGGNRWRIVPADMVTEFLRRDLREAGLFRAVLSERDAEEGRFSMDGCVEEFIENRETRNRKALLAVTITLRDLSRKEIASPVVLQKTYRLEAAVAGEGAAGLAAAMSLAMSDLSRQVIADIAAVLNRAI